jgi:hypothetical protein
VRQNNGFLTAGAAGKIAAQKVLSLRLQTRPMMEAVAISSSSNASETLPDTA